MKCIIADDHGLLRAGLKELLKNLDPRILVQEAGTFSELMEVMNTSADIDLILLDLVLPGTDDLEGLKTVKSRWPATAVVLVSATESPIIIREALHSGASGYIPKSTPVEHLHHAFWLILAGGVYVPPGILTTNSGQEPAPASTSNTMEATLSERQQKIVHCIADGLNNREIAKQFDLAEQTIKNEVSKILKLLKVPNRAKVAALVNNG